MPYGTFRIRFLAAAGAAALLGAGCAGPPSYFADTFEAAPGGWMRIGRGGERPADDLRVEHGRMLLGGAAVLRREFPFGGGFRGIADLAIEGGDAEGFAGVFVEEVRLSGSGTFATYHSLAVDSRGQWRGHSGDPLRPPGVRAWTPLAGRGPAQPVRFLIEKTGDRLVLGIDGVPAAEYSVRVASGSPEVSAPEFRIGIFTNLLDIAADNCIAGDDPPGGRFDAPAHVRWGTLRDAEALQRLAAERAEAFSRAPRRMAILGVLEPLRAAERIFRERGEEQRAREIAGLAWDLARSLEDAVARAGAGDLLRAALAGWGEDPTGRNGLLGALAKGHLERARAAEAGNRPAEALIFYLAAAASGAGGEAESGERRLWKTVAAPLRLRHAFQDRAGSAPKDLGIDPREFSRPAAEAYGAIPRSEDGELEVEVVLEEARLVNESAETTRRVVVTGSRSPLTPELRRELETLEKRFAADLADAVLRVKVMRAGNITPDLESLIRPCSFSIPPRGPFEIHRSDCQDLERACLRIIELQKLRESEERLAPRVESIAARLETELARFRVAFRVKLGGKAVLDDAVEAAEGLEQWIHPADPARGIPESRYQKDESARLVEAARRRALSRLRTAISRDSLFGKLDADAATALLARLARATRSRDDADLLRWRLKSTYALDGLTLESVARRLLEGE